MFKSIKAFVSKHSLSIILFVCTIVCFMACYAYYWQFKQYKLSDSTANWGTFGDYIGGIVGSVFSLISVVLLYYTFHDQIKNSQRQRFENKYYELIKLHRANVDELVLADEKGKKIFVILLREFRETLKIVKQVSAQHMITVKRKELIEIAYLVLFYGTGPNSTRVLISSLPDYTNEFIKSLSIALIRQKQIIKLKRKFDFTPFEGHQSRLGHYYRHLYQTIVFVDTQDILNTDEKINYIKTIRAQLSNHEQALLFFNSISRIGKKWREEGLIYKYSLIKNLPKSFIDEVEEIDVKLIYPLLKFEWEE